MEFVHLPPKVDLKLRTKNVNGRRYYFDPNDKLVLYPSITTVLDGNKKPIIKAWRKRVGAKVADKISKAATARGNSFHSLMEMYLNNEPMKEVLENTTAKHKITFNQAKPLVAKNINNIHCQETPLLSKILGIAGRVDLIAEWDGVLSVIDFKGSNKMKREEWITNYFMQGSGYSFMYWEMTKILPKQVVIVISSDDFTCKIYKKKVSEYIDPLRKEIARFKKEVK